MLNSELDLIGLSNIEKGAYWQDKAQRTANDKTDPTNRQQIKDAYNQAITDLDTIIAFGSPTLAQLTTGVKNLAGIQKKILLYLRSEIQ